MKQCPYCAESIQDAAIKCRYCSSHLSGSPWSSEWYRLSRGRMVAGVCAGLSDMFGVSRTALRAGLVLLTLIGFGWGIPVYLVLWVLMPLRESGAGTNSRTHSASPRTRPYDGTSE